MSYSKYIWNWSDATCRSSGTSFTNGNTINVPWEWTHTLYVCARDVAWNNSLAWNGMYRYDSVIPTITDDYTFDNIWNNVWTTITLTPADAAPSSTIASTRYCWWSSCNVSTWTLTSGPWITTIPATWQIDDTLRYRTWDVAWNASAIWTIAVKVDTTNPTISANNQSATVWRSNMWMNITLSVSDAWGSGISFARYSWDSSDATCRASWTSFTNGQNITSATIPVNPQGTHTLYLCTRDVAWNTNQWSWVYMFDDDNPTVVDNYTSDNIWTNVWATITLTPNDPNASWANSVSWVQTTRYCWGAGCNPSWGTVGTSIVVGPDVDNTLRYRTWDNAGNTSAIWSIIVRIEDNDPDTTMSFTRQSSATVYTPDTWVNYNVTWVINCTDTTWAINSGCNNATRQYRVQTSSFTCNSSWTWNNYNGTWIDFTETVWNESVRYVCSRIRDIATNGYVYSPVYTVRIDKDTPDISDLSITWGYPVDNSKLLADPHILSVTAGVSWGSPITLIEWYYENSATASSYGTIQRSTTDNDPANTDILTVTADLTNVDLDRHADWYRQYSFKVTKVRDEAWNEIDDPLAWVSLPHYLYYVFANSSTISDSDWASLAKNDVTTNQLDMNYVADWTNRLLRIELEDRYGNEVVHASDINREVDFTFDVSNNLKLDQYSASPSDGIYLDRPSTPWVFANHLSNTTTFTDESSAANNGIYNYNFQVYTPTYLSWATDGRQWANGDMTIHNIDYIVRQDVWPYIAWSHTWSIAFDGWKSEIDFVFRPLYQAEFTWDLSLGIFADTVQNANINVTKANTTTTSSTSLRLWFGQTNGANNNVAHPNYDFIYDPDGSASNINEWHQVNVTSLHNLWNLSTKNFDVKISHVSWAIDPSLPTYVSSHVRYMIWWVGPIVYDTHTVWKPRYVDGTNLVNTSQVWLKVLWRIQSKNQADITTGQSWTDLYALGNNSKAWLREFIAKQVELVTKNVTWANAWLVTVLWWSTWSNPNGTTLRDDTILYYDLTWSVNKIVDLWNGTDMVASWVKTIVIKWWNAYIRNNISYSSDATDMLWLIVLSDDSWNEWNIYLDPSVTNIAGIYYADKALISYTTADGEIDGSVWTSILSNQFYLFGTLFSENTIWGSIIPACPYYIASASCDLNEARKYDLNFLRRYFTYDNSDADLLENNVYNGWNSYFSYWDVNFKYPMVIEYNGNIQNTPPPLFKNEEF
jgi:hypothetical protein